MRLQRLTQKLPGDRSANTATVRTTVNGFVIGLVVWVIQRATGETLDPSNPLILAVVPAIIAFGYRVSRLLAARFPGLSWALFGIGTEPTYDDG